MVEWVAAGLIISYVPILTPSSHSNVDRRLVDCGPYFFHRRWQQPMALPLRNREFRANPFIKVPLHIGLEVVWMARWKLFALPIETLIHVKHVHAFQRYVA